MVGSQFPLSADWSSAGPHTNNFAVTASSSPAAGASASPSAGASASLSAGASVLPSLGAGAASSFPPHPAKDATIAEAKSTDKIFFFITLFLSFFWIF
jgi:hypothetical protein